MGSLRENFSFAQFYLGFWETREGKYTSVFIGDSNNLKNQPSCDFLFLFTVNLIAFTFSFKESVKNQ